MSKRCEDLKNGFEGGKMEPPYTLPKRDLPEMFVGGIMELPYTLPKRDLKWPAEWHAVGSPHQAKSTAGITEWESQFGSLPRHKATLGPILVTSILLLLGTVLVMRHIQHRTRREAPPFQSLARSEPRDVRLTRCFDSG